MLDEAAAKRPLPSWPIATALVISGFFFFVYVYTLIAPIIRDPSVVAPYSTQQDRRSKKKTKHSRFVRWFFGTDNPKHLQHRTPSTSRSLRRGANHDPEASPSSTTSPTHHSHTHAYLPSSPSSAKLTRHPITPSHPSFSPSYSGLHAPLPPSFSTSHTGVRISQIDFEYPSPNPHVRGGQHFLSPPPPAYVSSANSPSPEYASAFVDQGTGYATPPQSPGIPPSRTPIMDNGSTWSYYTPSTMASPSGSSLHGSMNRSSSLHSNALPPPSPSYNATLTVPPFNHRPVRRSLSGSSTASGSSASMYSANSAPHTVPSSQGHGSPPSRRRSYLNETLTAPLPDEEPVPQMPPPRVVTKHTNDKGKGSDTLNRFPLPPPLTIRTVGTGPYTPQITTSASVNAIGSQSTRYWPPSTSQLPTPPVSASSSFPSQPSPRPILPPMSYPHHPPPPPLQGPFRGDSRERVRESKSESAMIHALTAERVSRQPIVAAHMYPRNGEGAPILHLKPSPSLGWSAVEF